VNRFKEWGAFLFLGGFAWGTSFLWIKIGVEELTPFTLVFYRLVFGVAAIWVLLWFQRSKIDIPRMKLGRMALLGLMNTAIPFTLITWSETRIDSGLAGILNGTAPLFTIVIAHLFLHDEKIQVSKVIGLIIGFFGLITLLSRDIDAVGLKGNLWGQLATLLAAIFYAGSSVFVRRSLKDQHPILIATVTLTSAFIYLAILTPFVEKPLSMPHLSITWIAVAWLGIIGTALSYQLYFYLIQTWGPTRSILVTYVFPVVAVILGIIFLGEELHWKLIVGGSLIIGGIAAVNYQREKTSKYIGEKH
jgi:drug/metabolite transporter (DMT)-like permease